MALGLGRGPSLSDEEAMVTYYTMERDHAQRDEQRANGTSPYNISTSHRGYHRVDSRLSACKYPHSLRRRACFLHVVQCKVKFVRWALWALDLKITFITICFGCLIWQVTGISKYMTTNGRSREWLTEIQSIPDIVPPLFIAMCGGIPRAEENEMLCKWELLFTDFDKQ